MPKILNVRTSGRYRKGAVYCGRPSPFGNPFEIGKDGDRDTVINMWINHLHDTPDLVERIRRELRGKDLLCWCAPARCHCDVTLQVANGGPLPPRVAIEAEPFTPDLFDLL